MTRLSPRRISKSCTFPMAAPLCSALPAAVPALPSPTEPSRAVPSRAGPAVPAPAGRLRPAPASARPGPRGGAGAGAEGRGGRRSREGPGSGGKAGLWGEGGGCPGAILPLPGLPLSSSACNSPCPAVTLPPACSYVLSRLKRPVGVVQTQRGVRAGKQPPHGSKHPSHGSKQPPHGSPQSSGVKGCTPAGASPGAGCCPASHLLSAPLNAAFTPRLNEKLMNK